MTTALIVIDMQNSFLHPDGENFYDDAKEVIGPVQALIAAAREHGRLIIHTVDRHREGLVDFEHKRLPEHCVAGGFDAAFFEGFGPRPGALEIELVKRRFSAFFATDLGLLLNEQSVDRVIICGVKTNVCVRATAQDAFANGFEVILPRQATNSNRTHLAEASMEDIERYLGKLVDLEQALDMLS